MSKQSALSKAIFKGGHHYLTSPFGYRIHPISKVRLFHSGTDYGTSGKKINQYAVGEGYVQSAGKSSTGALYAWVVYPKQGIKVLHYHNDRIFIKRGQKVNENTVIGTTGTTGNSTGIHLHMGVKDLKTGKYIDGHAFKLKVESKQIMWIGKVTSETLRVRNNPTVSGSKVIRTLNKGDLVEVSSVTGNEPFDWLKIGDGEYVSNARGEYVAEVEEKMYEAEVTVNNLNVRQGPGTNYKKFDQVHNGDRINVLAEIKKPDYLWLYLGDGKFIADGGWTKKISTNIFRKGDKVKVKPGSGYASFVYDRVHIIKDINEDNKTALVTFDGVAMDWVPMKNLIKL